MLRIDENYNIFLTRGDSATFNLTIYEDDGETPYIMQPGDTLLFTVRRLYDQGKILITKVFNALSFQLMPSDTAALTTGKYRYDICIYNGSGWIDTFLNNKIFEIGEEVHDFSPPVESLLDRVGEGLPNDDLNILTPIGNLRGALSSGGIVYPQIVGSASGDPAHFTDGTFNYLLNLDFNIDTYRSGSGTPTPANPRPFEPITGADVIVSNTSDPAEGTTYNIDWSNIIPEGIFGGKAETVSHNLTITRKRVKAKDLTWNYSSGSGGYFSSSSLNEKELGAFNIEAEIFITSESTSITYMEENSIKGADNAKRIYVRCNEAGGDVDLFKEILGESYFVYDIDPDETYTGIITPDILSVEGNNYIWASTGTINEVKYVANINTFLQWIYDNLYNP